MRWNIIKHFSNRNTFGFTIEDLAGEFPARNIDYLGRLLADMVDKGMLGKIARGIYYIIPLHENPKTYWPDQYQVAKYIMRNKEYYIGYASAMEIHGLKFHEPEIQDEGREYVVTKGQRKPAVMTYGDITYQFIQHIESRFFGFSNIWINKLEKAMVSDLEKTIVDISTKPQLSGGIIDVGKAIFHSIGRTDHDKLFYYFSRNINKSAKKRFLFLTELLGLKWTAEHDRLKKELGTGFSLLDPSAPDLGRKQKKFGLKINVDPSLIKEKAFNPNRY